MKKRMASSLRVVKENLSIETQELINSILIELYPELVDNLELETGADENMFLFQVWLLMNSRTS